MRFDRRIDLLNLERGSSDWKLKVLGLFHQSQK